VRGCSFEQEPFEREAGLWFCDIPWLLSNDEEYGFKGIYLNNLCELRRLGRKHFNSKI